MHERGIKRPVEYRELIESLKKKDIDNEWNQAPFETYAQIMVFAATVGAKLCPATDFDDKYKSEGDPIKFEIFKNSGLDGIIHILALHRNKNLNNLTEKENGEKKISIFEGYAYAGFKKLQSVIDRPGHSVNNLIDFIKSNMEKGDDDDNGGTGEINLINLTSS